MFSTGCLDNIINNNGGVHVFAPGAQGNEIVAEFSQCIIFDPKVSYIIIAVDSSDTSTGSDTNRLQNIHIHQGVAGTESAKKEILEKRNLSYQVNYRPAGSEEKTI